MNHKINHLLHLDKQRIIMLMGIPGSGKSTLANEFKKVGYQIVCPDTYRGIISKSKPDRDHWTLSMHESDQEVSKEAWEMAYRESLKALKNGQSIVFDAMHSNAKSRRRLFAQLDKVKIPYYAIFNDVELITAIERNESRFNNGGRLV